MARIDFAKMRDFLKVYFITGSINCTKDPEHVLKEAIEGGITIFQFREKGSGCLNGDEKVQLAGRLQTICRKNRVPFIVNDDIGLALTLDADGVHVGQEDLTADEVRKKIGGKILGVSVHSEEEAQAAIRAGADYLGIGPIFATSTKEDAKPERGTGLIEELRSKGYDIPIVGIGGINSGNAASVVRAGADGVSVITAISLSPDIAAEARELKNQVSIGQNTD